MKKSEDIIVAFDVGGTYSKGMVFDATGQALLKNIGVYPSKAKGEPAQIARNFVAMMEDLVGLLPAQPGKISGLRLAFPGPFDYVNGISYIQGLNKLESLYGQNLKMLLSKALLLSDLMLTENFEITFLNDALSFALGEYFAQATIHRGGYFTLGTGFGSTFIIDGQVLRGQGKIPASGMIFAEPFLQGRMDDYLSARGLTALTKTCFGQAIELEKLAELANQKNATACRTFAKFGENIGRALKPYIAGLSLQELVFGGQISKSFTFFQAGIQAQIGTQIKIRPSADTSKSTLRGLFYSKNYCEGDV